MPRPANWLCLPGRTDVCSTPLATTALNPNGYGSTGQSSVAKDAAVDCFYVYPTVSRDHGLNSDLIPGDRGKGVAAVQFARFASVCRTFAPIYRQMTVGAVRRMAAGRRRHRHGSPDGLWRRRRAWRDFLATSNKGRPFVLIGHSQGALMLIQLIAHEIEGKPAAKRG